MTGLCMVDPLIILGILCCRRTAHVKDIEIVSREQLLCKSVRYDNY